MLMLDVLLELVVNLQQVFLKNLNTLGRQGPKTHKTSYTKKNVNIHQLQVKRRIVNNLIKKK
ncbi:unnamed protein product [Acanthoscelides obtectus]|uniref:Uncharacterized protein n=1 Tax=Acanthoscelides obtectus TaxID=200917 RepID=A0A9P0NX22_ACAOB|nr:unnamed protein product [Acanthoscelides obtectus]CAK1665732.1 hypothetical protein AOBTE_LOCUS24941 [Acanthoscelides obtectus]